MSFPILTLIAAAKHKAFFCKSSLSPEIASATVGHLDYLRCGGQKGLLVTELGGESEAAVLYFSTLWFAVMVESRSQPSRPFSCRFKAGKRGFD